jgi:hypothetical protein
MKPPENKSGDHVAAAAAPVCVNRAKTITPDALGETVKPEPMAAWVDEAIATLRRAAKDPVEFQRLGIWLQRMRRALV